MTGIMSAEVKKCCENCIYFAPAISARGRPCPSKPGECDYIVAWPYLPNSISEKPMGVLVRDIWQLCKKSVYTYNGRGCAVYEANPDKTKKAAKRTKSPDNMTLPGMEESNGSV